MALFYIVEGTLLSWWKVEIMYTKSFFQSSYKFMLFWCHVDSANTCKFMLFWSHVYSANFIVSTMVILWATIVLRDLITGTFSHTGLSEDLKIRRSGTVPQTIPLWPITGTYPCTVLLEGLKIWGCQWWCGGITAHPGWDRVNWCDKTGTISQAELLQLKLTPIRQ